MKEMKKYPISKIFTSFVNEAPNTGKYATHIQFSGCNMDVVGGQFCSFCDAKYANFITPLGSETGPPESNPNWMTAKEISNKIDTNLIIYTGGEPALYQEAIQEIGNICFEMNKYQIETNGSIELENDTMTCLDMIVISPKFPPGINHTYDLKVFDSDWKDWNYYTVKFVWESEESEPYFLECIEKYDISPEKVWIMPEGKTHLQLIEKAKLVMNFCKKHCFNFSTRLNVMYGV